MLKSNRERLTEIVKTLASYGFGHIVRTRMRKTTQEQDARNLRLAFEELGPSFIKIGQIISTRQDLLPREYINELSKLRDEAPPIPFSDVEYAFRKEFNQSLDDVFIHVDKKPIGSASVAQVHKGTMKDGREIVLKVQRPQIEETLLRDIRLFSRILNVAPDILKDMLVDADEALKEIEESTRIEMDLRNEARHLKEFRALNDDVEVVNAPEPIFQYTSKTVIVEEYVDGIRNLNPLQLIEAGYDTEDIGNKLVFSFLKQVFEDGFFHGDPHPGNIIISDQQIIFLDFGIVGLLSNGVRDSLKRLLKAIVTEDIEELMNLILQMAVTDRDIDRHELYDDLNVFYKIYVKRSFEMINMNDLFSDILNITHKHKLVMPNDFIMLAKSLTILEGVVQDLNSDINIMGTAKLFLQSSKEFDILNNFSSDKVLLDSYQLAKDTLTLPASIKGTLDTIANGHLKAHIDLIDFEEKWTGINKMANRMVFAVVIAALILSSAFITVMAEGTWLAIFGIAVFLFIGILSLWLIYSIFKSGNL